LLYILLRKRHLPQLPNRSLQWIVVLFERNLSVFPSRIAGERATCLRLSQAAWIHNCATTHLSNKGRVGVTNEKNVSIDRLNLFLP
jgi:hypothetical protein